MNWKPNQTARKAERAQGGRVMSAGVLELLAALVDGRGLELAIPTGEYSYRWEDCDLDRALFLLGNRRAESLRVKRKGSAMTLPELPPLRPSTYGQAATKSEPQPRTYTAKSVEARERILQARIAELEADAARLDSGRIMFTTRDVYGEPARVTFAGVDLRAAIDAAREAKP